MITPVYLTWEKSTGKYLSLQTVCNMFGVAGQRKLLAGY